MAAVVVALGGSLLRPEVEDRHEWLLGLVSIIEKRVSAGDKIALVVGGGAPAREGISLAKEIIGDTKSLDRIGIAATRLNATIVKEALFSKGIPVSDFISTSIDEAVSELNESRVVVMGGTEPGHTTDAVAIRLAIMSGAEKCVIATNVSGVYSRDPKEDPESESFEEMTLEELQKIVGPAEHRDAGKSQVVDPIGVDEAFQHGLALDILDGREIEKIMLSLEGNHFGGTVVKGK